VESELQSSIDAEPRVSLSRDFKIEPHRLRPAAGVGLQGNGQWQGQFLPFRNLEPRRSRIDDPTFGRVQHQLAADGLWKGVFQSQDNQLLAAGHARKLRVFEVEGRL